MQIDRFLFAEQWMDERHQTLGKAQVDFPPVLTLKRAPLPKQRDGCDLTGLIVTQRLIVETLRRQARFGSRRELSRLREHLGTGF